VDAPVFWHRFQHSVAVLCIGELKESLLGLSCLGSRGIMPLFANLCSSFSIEQIELLKQRAPPQLQVRWRPWEPARVPLPRCPPHRLPRRLPQLLQEYVAGMDNEVYELRCFPRHLHGKRFREAVLDLARSDVLLLGLGLAQEAGGMAFTLAPLDEVGGPARCLPAAELREAGQAGPVAASALACQQRR
jgi:hypothetical protein